MKFWTSPKRPPFIIDYDSSNEAILNFIHAAANILSYTYNLGEISREMCKDLSDKMNLEKFVAKKAKI